MAVDFAHSWVQNGVTFNLADPYDPEGWDDEELVYRIPTGETPGEHGEYQEDSSVEARLVSLSGRLIADDPDTLRTRWDTLTGAFQPGASGRLYRNSDRFLQARVASIRRAADEGLNYIDWRLTFRATPPFYQAHTADSLGLSYSTGGSVLNNITPGGNVRALPAFTLVVDTPGTVSLTHAGTGQNLTLDADAAGLYVLTTQATREHTATRDGVDCLDKVSGEFIELVPAASTLTLALSGGAVLSQASVTWRKRYLGG